MAIGGIADEPLTGIAPTYFTGSHAQRIPEFTRRHVDELCAAPYVMTFQYSFERSQSDMRSARNSRYFTALVVLSLGDYRGELRRAIHQMKFRNARWITARFGRNLGRASRERFDDWSPDIVTWAPTTKRRIRLRGHDQSSIIADSVARTLGVQRVRCLRRTDDRAQTGTSRTQRHHGPRYVVRARSIRGKRVLLVDDVMTTGTTLVRARDALLAAGALEVRCAVVAHVRRARQ